MTDKIKVNLSKVDGNIFAILANCSRALKNAGQFSECREMFDKVNKAKSYHEALAIVMEYVDVSL